MLILAADHLRFGRIDYDSLPEQTMMELLIARVPAKTLFEDSSGNPLDVQEWGGIEYDEEEFIEEVDWHEKFTNEGTIDLEWIPPKVVFFDIRKNELHGTLNCALLPIRLQHLNLGNNLFTGTIDLVAIPKTMHEFIVSANQFHGTVDLSRLPEGLRQLYLDNNEFSGKITLHDVPLGIDMLFDNNPFSQAALKLCVPIDRFSSLSVMGTGVAKVVDKDGKEIRDYRLHAPQKKKKYRVV